MIEDNRVEAMDKKEENKEETEVKEEEPKTEKKRAGKIITTIIVLAIIIAVILFIAKLDFRSISETALSTCLATFTLDVSCAFSRLAFGPVGARTLE